MATDSGGTPPKKPSTAEILAKARAQAAQKAAGEAAPAEPAPVAETPAAAPAAPSEAPAGKPKSTADILAAARAQAAAKAAGAAASDTPAPVPATAAPAGDKPKPKSTADILAAARAAAAAKAAGGASGAAAAPATVSAPAAAKPAGPKPSVQEMIAAVRGGTEGVAAAPVAPARPVAPPMPVKPQLAAAKGKKADDVPRRNFLVAAVAAICSPFVLAWTSFAAASTAGTLAILRFMLPNVLTEPPSKFKVGPLADYDLGTVSEKWKAQFGIWVVHTDKYQGKNLIYALSSVCTHLGCTPSWLESEQKFKCPCHGSGFYITGVNFEGPAPRPLERVGLRLAEDGMLEVDKSVKFQEEMGQWTDGASFVDVG